VQGEVCWSIYGVVGVFVRTKPAVTCIKLLWHYSTAMLAGSSTGKSEGGINLSEQITTISVNKKQHDGFDLLLLLKAHY
jgi:hypothetical protein